MTLLCASPRCRIPGRHADSCERENCPGCQTARAADGLRLCWHCTGRIGRDAVELARLWYEIGLILTAGGANGTPVSNPHPGLVLNAGGAAMRAEIRHMLASWCKLVAEERGLGLPGRWKWRPIPLPDGELGPLNREQFYAHDESQHGLGAYIRLHEQWLAATDYAGEAADELAALRGRAWAVAYPEGVSVRLIGPCPELVDGALCPGNVKALMRAADSLLPNKVVCDVDSTHEWPSERWRTLGRSMGRVLDGYLTADVIAQASGRSITAIYRWASERQWRRIPDGRRVRYDARDVADTFGWAA